MNYLPYFHPKIRADQFLERIRLRDVPSRDECAFMYGYLQCNSDCWEKVRINNGKPPSPRTANRLAYLDPDRRAKIYLAELSTGRLTTTQKAFREGYLQSLSDNKSLEAAKTFEIRAKEQLRPMRNYSEEDIKAIFKGTNDFTGSDL